LGQLAFVVPAADCAHAAGTAKLQTKSAKHWSALKEVIELSILFCDRSVYF
jgi:hypothetical protein